MEIVSKNKQPTNLRKRDMVFLVATAFIFDVISIVPGKNILSALLGQSVIPFIFSRYGINIFSSKRIIPYLMATLVEIVPGASILPAFTIETLCIIWLSKRAERRSIKSVV